MTSLSIVHLVALIAGILLILLIKKRYRKISRMELTVIIALYVFMVLLFTDPIVNWIRHLLS